MAYSRRLDFMFCELCGTMLSLNSTKYAQCSLCGSKRKAKEICGREICLTATAKDIQRELGIKPFVKAGGLYIDFDGEEEVRHATTRRTCEKCGHPELEYYTRQTRSADEGETAFYHCRKCGHRFKEG
ncbi:hypothetical protein L1049_011094 [Liquidambar formosana]|uniref:DNA-directed RNA polymerase subunit n=1 Tax=Liquidambar formosana TaxID=63359 RepID=A0AAP0RRA3_LIQFO